MRFEVEEVATPNEGSPASILVAQLASPSCLFMRPIGYSKENLKIHMGVPSPPSLPSVTLPSPSSPPLPSLPLPFSSLPIPPSLRSMAP